MLLALDIVGLSLDGSTAAMHRRMRGGHANFEAVLDAARIVRSRRNVLLKIATVVSSVNRDDILLMPELVTWLRADIWRIYQYVPTGTYNRGQPRHTIPEADFLQVTEAARARVAPLPVFASTASTQGPGCLIISMDGTVFHAGPEADIVHGTCVDSSLDEIWKEIAGSRSAEIVVSNKEWHEMVLRRSLPRPPLVSTYVVRSTTEKEGRRCGSAWIRSPLASRPRSKVCVRGAGLRQDRFADTGIAIDALAGLTTVRQLVTSGLSAEAAIVRTARDAATRLSTTDSIVADVILGLGLQPEPLPDRDLYASDLGQRRVALRRNWRRLHELRSRSWSGNVPSQRAIRFELETQALNALASALTADDGTIQVPTALGAPVATNRPIHPVPLLSDEFRRIAAALRDALVIHQDGMGWARDLGKESLRPTPVSTSDALQTILLLKGYLSADLVPVVDFLRRAAATRR